MNVRITRADESRLRACHEVFLDSPLYDHYLTQEGRLDSLAGGETVSAGPGEVLHIPRGSDIQFSAKGKVRFLYFVYPADWQK